MDVTTYNLYKLKEKLEQIFLDAPTEDKLILKQYGLYSENNLFIKKFINLLCRKGRNTGKFLLNAKRVDTICLQIQKIKTDLDPLEVILKVLLRVAHRVKVIYVKQGSITVTKKVFLMPNVTASITLRKLAQLARTLKCRETAQQICLTYDSDNKSKLITGLNEVVKLAKAASE
jgi:ribosomal protein S7